MYRQRAEQADDPIVKNELLELASVCEEVANNSVSYLRGPSRSGFTSARIGAIMGARKAIELGLKVKK